MATSRKRNLELAGVVEEDIDVDSYKANTYKKRAAEPDCTQLDKLDKKFISDTDASLVNSQELKQCMFDSETKECRRKNPEHFKEYSHKHQCNKHDIEKFKKDTDIFLQNTYNIYKCNGDTFSTAWNTKVGADRGAHKLHLKTCIYDEYDTFIFSMLANIALNLNKYETLYGPKFLEDMLFGLETNDNTGLFPIEQYRPIREIFTKYAPIEGNSKKIDYRLSNTTLRGIIENRLEKTLETEAGGGKRKKKTMKKNRKKNKKTHKRKHYIKRK
jgi:hypothetical protein